MKYVIHVLPEREMTREHAEMIGASLPLSTEEDAIKEAAKLSRGKNTSVGIFKIVKQVDPPNVNIKDVD